MSQNVYKIAVEILNVLDVDANSEEEAIARVTQNLVASKQIKECDPVKIYVIKEQSL